MWRPCIRGCLGVIATNKLHHESDKVIASCLWTETSQPGNNKNNNARLQRILRDVNQIFWTFPARSTLIWTNPNWTTPKDKGGNKRVLLKKGLITQPFILEPEDSAEWTINKQINSRKKIIFDYPHWVDQSEAAEPSSISISLFFRLLKESLGDEYLSPW